MTDLRTPHFLLSAPPGSFAAEQFGSIAERLEHAFSLITDKLLGGVEPAGQMRVVLREDTTSGTEPGAIQDTYRPDAPGATLERLVLQVLLADGQPWPAPLLDCLLAHLERTAPADFDLSLPVARLLRRGAPYTPTESAAVGEFAAYVIAQHGLASLRHLLAGADSRLERQWRKQSPRRTGSAVMRFLRLSGASLRAYPGQLAQIAALTVLSVGTTLFFANAPGLLLDRALLPRDMTALLVLVAAIVVLFVVSALVSLRQSVLTASLAETVARELRLRLFARIQQLHMGYFQQVPTGDILSRLGGDLSSVQFGLTTAFFQAFRLGLTVLAAVANLLHADARLALVAIVGSPLLVISNRLFAAAVARASRARQNALANVSAAVEENLGAQRVIKAFSLEDAAYGEFRAVTEAYRAAAVKTSVVSSRSAITGGLLASGIQLSVLSIGAWLVMDGNLSVGTLFIFLGLVSQVIGPVQGLADIVRQMQESSGALSRIEELLTAEPAIVDASPGRELPPLRHAVRFESVTFGYPGRPPILNGLDLEIPAGANVAIVGPSGAGKSTVLQLLMRFEDPRRGRVTFDGTDLRDVRLSSLRGQLGVVFQETVLFDRSIRDNLRLSHPAADDAAIERAARAAEIHDRVRSLPDGYLTRVGERGGRLSGGERQRLAIARAILRDPAVLLLDEATSALDPHTESAINQTLLRLARGRTVISVTHRLASAVTADCIYVLDRGQLAEQGTHTDLLAHGGIYAQLWREQHGLAEEPSSTADIARELHSLPVFAELDSATLGLLAERVAIEDYPTGKEVVVEGDPADRFYLVRSGELDVFKRDTAGTDRWLATLKEGDYFGEVALLYSQTRSATVRARKSTRLWSLAADEFLALVAQAPRVGQRLEHTLVERDAVPVG